MADAFASKKDMDALEKRVIWLERHTVESDQKPYDLTTKLETDLRKRIADLEARIKALE